MDFQSLFLSANGRIGRQEFWIGFLILFAGGFVIGLIPILNILFAFASIYFWVCLYAKRLHDVGKSAFLVFIPYGVWFVALIAAMALGGFAIFSSEMARGGDDMSTAAGLGGVFLALGIGFLASLAFLLWVGLSEGQPGDNRYGAPPAAHPVTPAVQVPVAAPPPAPSPSEPSPPPSEPPVA